MPDRPSIPAPVATVSSLLATAEALREGVELLQGQRGGWDDAVVTWGDLVNLGLIKPDQVPKNVGINRPR